MKNNIEKLINWIPAPRWRSGARFAGMTIGLLLPRIAAAQPYVPGLEFLGLQEGAELGDILAQLYIFGVALAATAAFIMLVIGGVQYMLAGDRDPSAAKERIKNALWGLALALTSWLILNVINPQLLQKVKIEPIKIIALNPSTPFSPVTDCAKAPPGECGKETFAHCQESIGQTGTSCAYKSSAIPPGGYPVPPKGTYVPPIPAPPTPDGKCSQYYKLIDGMCYGRFTQEPCNPREYYFNRTTEKRCEVKTCQELKLPPEKCSQ